MAGGVPLNPSNTYPRAGNVEILLEAEDLPSSSDVAVRFRIEPAGGLKTGPVETRYTVRPVGSTLVLRQSLSLSTIPPGYYRLTVEVGPEGRSLSRSQPLWVVPWAQAGPPLASGPHPCMLR